MSPVTSTFVRTLIGVLRRMASNRARCRSAERLEAALLIRYVRMLLRREGIAIEDRTRIMARTTTNSTTLKPRAVLARFAGFVVTLHPVCLIWAIFISITYRHLRAHPKGSANSLKVIALYAPQLVRGTPEPFRRGENVTFTNDLALYGLPRSKRSSRKKSALG